MNFCFWIKVMLISIPLWCKAATPLVWQEVQIPMQTSQGKIMLVALLVIPDDHKKHPVALINHGSPRNALERAGLSPLFLLPTAYEFARRGYATAVVLRRGYGNSGGGWAEGYGSCTNTDYLKAAHAAAEDLHAAINYLGTLPAFDTNTILVVGHSAGGFATVALSAFNPPKGMKAAISFAGGRGSYGRDKVCQEDRLVDAFAQLGKTSRIPMLWVYADNDHFFGPQLAKKFYKAFTDNGGNARFIAAPAFGSEGHFLFTNSGISQWTSIVDRFLLQQHLVRLQPLLPLPSSSLKTPTSFSSRAQQAFTSYKKSMPHKAFAASASGAFGWRSGQKTQEDAENKALALCKHYGGKGCVLIAVDEELR